MKLVFFLMFVSFQLHASSCVETVREIYKMNDGVVSAISVRDIDYARTNRNYEKLVKLYGQSVLNLSELRGKRILDAGTGGGELVHHLREQQIDAVGIDIFLDEKQKNFSYFLEQDILNLNFKSESFDTIFSSFSILYYSQDKQEVYLALVELKRILKKGGGIHIAPSSYTVDEVLNGPLGVGLFSRVVDESQTNGKRLTLIK